MLLLTILALALTWSSGACSEAEVRSAEADVQQSSFGESLSSARLAPRAASATKDYAEALRLSLLFYYAQRSGKLPSNNPIPWRGDSALHDCVVGGWYDAGDHVKFGYPMAGSLTMLLWGALRFKQGYVAANQLNSMYDTVKWGLDYLLKAWNPNTQELVIQIGDADVDHSFWGRPEDMTMNRPCIKIDTRRPGSDVAGETAAALALGSIVFKDKGDSSYSAKLLQASKQIYTFAKNHRGRFSNNPVQDSTSGWTYSSDDDKDEMCEAAMWLYKATGTQSYLTDGKAEHEHVIPNSYNWDEKKLACQLLLYEETKTEQYKQEVNSFLANWRPGGDKTYTPCGFAWSQATDWGAARHTANAAFAAVLAAADGLNAAENRKWAAEQINYLLGDNHQDGGCYSFEIGYGHKYPLRPHHRAASCPTLPAPCPSIGEYDPSPQTLNGGLVGGPTSNDVYKDSRWDYVHNEVALDYNAGFQSALAGLTELVSRNQLPATNNKCPCHEQFTGSHAPIIG